MSVTRWALAQMSSQSDDGRVEGRGSLEVRCWPSSGRKHSCKDVSNHSLSRETFFSMRQEAKYPFLHCSVSSWDDVLMRGYVCIFMDR